MRLGTVLLLGPCRLEIEVVGREHLPNGGYIAVCALHRSWIDPMLVIHALPIAPRVWFLGSGPTAFDRRWKERLLRHIGGMLPVWRGGHDLDVHVRAADAVIQTGAVLALFLEGAVGGPADRPARLRAGSGLLALRTAAPIVPVAICGTDELYRGKRMAVRILPSTTPEGLLGDRWPGVPESGSRDELSVAHALSEAIAASIAAVVSDAYPHTADPASRPRRWTWLSRLFR